MSGFEHMPMHRWLSVFDSGGVMLMRYVALLVIILICSSGLVPVLRLAWSAEETSVRSLLSMQALAFLVILAGSIAVFRRSIGQVGNGLVAVSCGLVPLAWLVGCLDHGMISGLEALSVIGFGAVSLCLGMLFVYLDASRDI